MMHGAINVIHSAAARVLYSFPGDIREPTEDIFRQLLETLFYGQSSVFSESEIFYDSALL